MLSFSDIANVINKPFAPAGRVMFLQQAFPIAEWGIKP